MVLLLGFLLVSCSFAQSSAARLKQAPNTTALLRDLSGSLEALSHRVSPAVVQIFATGYAVTDEGDNSGAGVITRQHASGSGVLLSADGYIITNSHVVGGARRLRVHLTGGPRVEAKVVGMDRDTDLAVIKIEQTGLPHLELGDSDTLRQGQLVLAFGNPLGLEGSVSMGVVSSTARQIRPDDSMIYIQTDAPINPGNSGGPLVDAAGEVMGINTFIFSQSGGSEGIGFAIPSNVVRSVYQQIHKTGHVHRADIGVSPQTITPELAEGLQLERNSGVLLGDVQPEGPAETAGVKVGDIVLSLNGRPMQNARQLGVALYRYSAGQTVKLEVLRGKDQMTFSVPVVERQNEAQRFPDMVDPTKNLVPELGILGIGINRDIAQMLPDLRKSYGVVVAARAGDKPYSGPSLDPGDVIYSVNTTPVTTVEALREALKSIRDGSAAVLQVERDGTLMYLAVELE